MCHVAVTYHRTDCQTTSLDQLSGDDGVQYGVSEQKWKTKNLRQFLKCYR